MVKISACIIAKNEAEAIGRCLRSVNSIVNEIIVVDTGSTDDTVDVARRLGAKIAYFQWNNDFGAAKNYALKQAKGDWIIFLDADEYILASKVANVRSFIEKIHDNPMIESVICRMEHTDGVDGRFIGCNPTVRIFRNSRAIRYEGKIHEWIFKNGQPTKSVQDNEQSIVIRHTGYSKGRMIEKLKRNTRLLEEELNNGVVRDLTYHYLSDGYWKFGQYEKAIRLAHQAIAQKELTANMFVYKPYVILMDSMIRLGTYNAAVIDQIRERAIQKFPRHPEILMYQGLCFLADGRYRSALDSFQRAIEANAGFSDLSVNNEFYIYIAKTYLNIAKIYNLMNQPVEALDYFVKALQQDRYHQEAFAGLLSVMGKQNPADVVYFLNRLYTVTDPADVEFLVANLSRLKVGIVLDYYQRIWSKQFGHTEYGGMVLLSNRLFERAFQYFATVFRESGAGEAELLAVLALLLGGTPDGLDSLGQRRKLSFTQMITAFFDGGEAGFIPPEAFPDYLDLLNDFVLLCDEKQLEQFLKVGKGFAMAGAVAKIGDVLIKEGLFQAAFELFSDRARAAQLCSAAELSRLYCKMGFCRFKLKDYAGAVFYFTKSLDAGYRGKDVFEFLEWSYRQCADDELRDELLALRSLYDAQPAEAECPV